jgi:hypothetical protein
MLGNNSSPSPHQMNLWLRPVLSYSINVTNSVAMELKNYNNSFSVVTEKRKRRACFHKYIHKMLDGNLYTFVRGQTTTERNPTAELCNNK